MYDPSVKTGTDSGLLLMAAMACQHQCASIRKLQEYWCFSLWSHLFREVSRHPNSDLASPNTPTPILHGHSFKFPSHVGAQERGHLRMQGGVTLRFVCSHNLTGVK